MLNKTMKILVPALLVLMGFSAQAQSMKVENAWIREAPPMAQMMGAYMTLKNDSAKPMALISAHSKAFSMIMIHRSVMKNGMMEMIKQKEVMVPAHGEVVFKPGSYHMMMPAPAKRLVAGDKVTITLVFKGGKKMNVVYTVRKDTMAMPGMDGKNTGHMHGM